MTTNDPIVDEPEDDEVYKVFATVVYIVGNTETGQTVGVPFTNPEEAAAEAEYWNSLPPLNWNFPDATKDVKIELKKPKRRFL